MEVSVSISKLNWSRGPKLDPPPTDTARILSLFGIPPGYFPPLGGNCCHEVPLHHRYPSKVAKSNSGSGGAAGKGSGKGSGGKKGKGKGFGKKGKGGRW